MGRLTRWGVDRRGRRTVPARLGRGFVLRRPRRLEVLEPIEDLEPDNPLPAPVGAAKPPWEVAELEAPDDDELEEDGEPLTERLRQARAPKDLSRFVAAMRAKSAPAAPARRPLEPAFSPEECRRCGIPGWKGCAHQLPYVADFVPVPAMRGANRRGVRAC